MARAKQTTLKHSVAFRVTEDEWKKLQRLTMAEKTSVPQLAKETLFARAGLEPEPRKRQPYGQSSGRKSD